MTGRLVHLDAAGCALQSSATVEAQVSYTRREGEVGGYEAAREAEGTLERATGHLARLLGVQASEIAFVENATRGFAELLAAWPLRRGAKVGVVPGEYGSNVMALQARARREAWELVVLRTDPGGRLDLEDLAGSLRRGLDLVVLPHIPSHRGTTQPAADAAALCREAGAPLVVDVAQSLGQVDASRIDADAYVGTSRKWLRGPRGVGFVAVRTPLADTLAPPFPNLGTARLQDSQPVFGEGARRLELGESSLASRVGLAMALAELSDTGTAATTSRIVALAVAARRRLAGINGWQLVEGDGADVTGTVTLRHDRMLPDRTARFLRSEGVVVAPVPVERAPLEMRRPVLRASFHVYCTEGCVDALASALERAPRVL